MAYLANLAILADSANLAILAILAILARPTYEFSKFFPDREQNLPMLEFSVNAIGKDRAKKRRKSPFERKFSFNILENMAQNKKLSQSSFLSSYLLLFTSALEIL